MPADREPVTLGALLQRAAAHADLGVRFIDRAERPSYHSYRELARRAAALARQLRAAGVKPGERVALVMPTGPEFYDGFFGALLAGAVPVPLYPPVRLGRLDEYHERTAAMLRGCAARLVLAERRVRRILGRAVERARPALGCLTVDELPAAAGEALPELRADDLALIQFSSGTTRQPKPIRLTHRQIVANVRRIIDALLGAYPEGPELRHAGVSWLPLYHDMGLVGCLLVSLAHPAELTLIPPELFVARPAVWLRTISRYRGTISPAPNFAFGLCADRIGEEELEQLDLSCWRVALNGAEPVTPAALDRFLARFARVGLREEALTPVYGLAEATLAVTFSPLRKRFATRAFDREALSGAGVAREAADGLPLVSLGRPLPGFELRIVDSTAGGLRRLWPGHVGRVQLRGPSVMDGYHGLPELSAAALPDGWLETGDRGFIWRGELFLYGREKDLVILRGRNHAPQDIEQSLDGLAGVRSGCAAAVGVVDAEAGERLVLLVERHRQARRADDPALVDRVRQRVIERTGLRPETVAILEPGALPRTSSGKIRRGAARERFAAGTLTARPAPGRVQLLRELWRSHAHLTRLRRATERSS